jgi:hypothetical protein
MSATGPRRGTLETIGVSQSDLTHPSQPGIEIRVLTSALYSRFVRFQTHREAFDKLRFDAPASEELSFISDRVAFLELLSRAEQIDPEIAGSPFRSRVLGWIRGKTPLHTVLFHNTVTYPHPDDRRICGLPKLDVHILNDGDSTSRRHYCHNMTALLLSDRLAFGWTQVMRLSGYVIWVFLVYVTARSNQKVLNSRSAGGTAYTCAAILGILGPHLWVFGSRLI